MLGKDAWAAYNCAACHGEPEEGQPVWSGALASIDLFDSDKNGYKAAGNAGQQNLNLARFINLYMPSEANSVSGPEGRQLAAYLSHNAGKPWCPGEDWPPVANQKTLPIKVLIVSVYGRNDTGFNHHDNGGSVKILEAMGPSHQIEFTSIHRTRYKEEDILAEHDLNSFDVLLVSGVMGNPFNEAAQQKVEAYIKAGGNFVGFWQAGDIHMEWTFYWEEMLQASVLGGRANKDNGMADITVDDSTNFITEPLPSMFSITGDIRWHQPLPLGKATTTVILRGTGPAFNKPGKPKWAFDNSPLAWVSETQWGGRTAFSGIAPPQGKDPEDNWDETEWFNGYVARLLYHVAGVPVE